MKSLHSLPYSPKKCLKTHWAIWTEFEGKEWLKEASFFNRPVPHTFSKLYEGRSLVLLSETSWDIKNQGLDMSVLEEQA